MTRTKMCASPRVTPSSLPPPHLFTNNIRNNFLPLPPRCLLLLLLRGRHRPCFPACRHHQRNNIASPAAAAASAGAFLKCALDESLLAVQPPRGASLSLLQTHTRRRRRRRRRPVCFLLFDTCVRLCCVFVLQACPSLLYIIHICSLLKYCLVSFRQHSTPYTHTHGEINSTNISHHTRTLEHTHHFTHPSMEGGSQRSGS